MVRAINGDLCAEFGLEEGDVSCAIQGQDFKAWLSEGAFSSSQVPELSAEFKNSLSQRLGLNFTDNHAGDSPAEALAALRQLKRRLDQPQAYDRLMTYVDRGGLTVKQWAQSLKQDPMMRARLLTPEIIQVMNPLLA